VIQAAIWDAAGGRRLGGRRGLPALAVDPAEVSPCAIVDAACAQLGLEVAFLRRARPDLVELEHLGGDLPPGLAWQAAELTPLAADRVAWQRPGWLREAVRTADVALRAAGIRRTGRPAQMRHGGISAILRLPTDLGPLWLKAVPPVLAQEGPVIAWLATLAPHAVPALVARGDGWWIAAQLPDATGAQGEDFLEALVRLQLATAGRTRELTELGCPDRPLDRLPDEIGDVSDRPDLVSLEHAEALRARLPALRSLCREVAGLGLPATLVHGDLHAGNARWTRRGWLLLDWTDACVAHPFVDLALPLSQERPCLRAGRAAAYGAHWLAAASRPAVERALQTAAAVGAAHQVVSYRRIIDGVGRSVAPHTRRRATDWIVELIARLS
jgi:hypothetical protein